jgi:hypothetical protein
MTSNRFASVAFLVLLGLALPHCARDASLDNAPSALDAGGGSGPSFTSPDATDGNAPDADASATAMCIATECPELHGTCDEALFKCQSKLADDPKNCGACGRTCPNDLDAYGMVSTCSAGKCVTACASTGYGNCNGIAEDGCETMLHCPNFEIDITVDPKNCGQCGKACPEGVECVGTTGECGCGALTQCGHGCLASCVDTVDDNNNCGECDNACAVDYPQDIPNSEVGCGNGECGKLKCIGFPFKDCNGDLTDTPTDGCETNVGQDNNNCGDCGVVCAAGSTCRGGICVVPFVCAPGLVRCDPYNDACTDLSTDRLNCGGCGRSCGAGVAAVGAYGRPMCVGGECTLVCDTGVADCDGRTDNGCEINTANDPLNCGGCGITCDVAAGQPCVDGKCLMRECDAGGPVQ